MMKTFKRKSICAAVLAGVGAVGMMGTAQAVNINPDNLGQVLIYPYYTVRNGFDTYLSVVNTNNETKAVKVRFLEGKNSREVLDFNLYLSPYDVWTGAIVATSDGAKLVTADKSCTTPAIPAGGQAFVNYAYTGAANVGGTTGTDGESGTLDRTREGYFEIIEMGIVTNPTLTAYIKHNSAGVPANCGAIQGTDFSADNDATGGVDTIAPTSGLSGTASLINVNGGADYGYDPVAIDNFATLGNIWNSPGSIHPNLNDGDNVTSNVFLTTSATVVSDPWATSVDAVSAVLQRAAVMNEYVLDTGSMSGTDWVVTFPTKWAYVAADNGAAGNPSPAVPFARPFTSSFWAGGACEPVSLGYYDREEAFVNSVLFSPAPPSGNTLCWEANVITFNNSSLLGSTNVTNFPVNYQNGWARMDIYTTVAPYSGHYLDNYVDGTGSSTDGTRYYRGLPTVGFMLQDFVNGTLTVNGQAVMSTYGGNFLHKYTRIIN